MVVRRGISQANRMLAVKTPLAEDALLLRSLNGSEGLSRLFHFHLELLSEDDSIKFNQLVGEKISVRCLLADGKTRHWHGIISRFSQGGRDAKLTSYHAEMVPRLWFLTRTADCRIFQNRTVPEIVEQVLGDLGLSFKKRIYQTYPKRDYCVQYRETDFTFVSRLLEEEGIFYFFDHSDGTDELILADDPAAHKPCPSQSQARYQTTTGAWQKTDVILAWEKTQEYRPGSWAQTDYNFEQPGTDLMVSVADANKYEIYDYPGEYVTRSDGDRLLKIRLQQETTPGVLIRGTSDCRAFTSGFQFDLQEHYRDDMNGKYVLTQIHHRGTQGGDFSANASGEGGESSYTNEFECIPADVTYRPTRATPRPFVQGCQTAMVVGPSGDEIYTDNYGRVKVQFHWDREGTRNENSSCWVRVSHAWAGKGWGGICIPRIGQEVVVDFLEGNPDQPIIIGRVYNGESMPPYGLPGGAVVSGIKSNSTKGGGGYNEIALDDTKGNELIRIHAQFDQDKKVEHDERVNVGNDRTESVGHDEKITIGNDRTEKVVNNENITIGVNRTESVGSNEDITIGSNRTEQVGVDETISIGSNRTETVGSNEMVTVALTRTHNIGVNDMLNVGGAQEVTIGGLQALTIGITRAKTIGVSENVTIGTSQDIGIGTSQSVSTGTTQSTEVGTDRNLKVGKNRNTSVGQDDKMKVGKTWAVEAGDQIAFKTGDASIVMKKNGNIAIQCKDLTIKASGKVHITSNGKMTLKGQQILEN